MKLTIFVILFMNALYAFAQENTININIVNSGLIDENARVVIEKILLSSSLDKKYDRVKVSIVNPFNDFTKSTVASISNRKFNWNSNATINSSIENTAFRSEDDFTIRINEKFEVSNSLVYALNESDRFKLNLFNCEVFMQDDIRRSSPIVKKMKELSKGGISSINIIMLSEMPLYKYSKERFLLHYKNINQSSRIAMIPKITSPRNYDQIRPNTVIDGVNYYTIRFDSVGYFDGYEIEIYRNNGELFYNDKVYFNENSTDIMLNYKNQGRVCDILLNLPMLVQICYGKWPPVELNEVPESDCDMCKYEELYNKNWNIRIRGVIENESKDDLWSDKVPRFEFQCPTKQ